MVFSGSPSLSRASHGGPVLLLPRGAGEGTLRCLRVLPRARAARPSRGRVSARVRLAARLLRPSRGNRLTPARRSLSADLGARRGRSLRPSALHVADDVHAAAPEPRSRCSTSPGVRRLPL
ncbi:unnamed protein product [Ixodes pacificus]